MEKIIAYNHKLEKDKKQIETQVLTIMQKKRKDKDYDVVENCKKNSNAHDSFLN